MSDRNLYNEMNDEINDYCYLVYKIAKLNNKLMQKRQAIMDYESDGIERFDLEHQKDYNKIIILQNKLKKLLRTLS